MKNFILKNRISWLSFAVFFALFGGFSFCLAASDDANPGIVEKDYNTTVCAGGTCEIPNPLGETDFSALVLRIMNDLIRDILTPLAAVMIIWAGFQFVTAGGNDAKITSAKKNLRYAITGLAVILLAQAIVVYVRKILGDETAGESTLMERITGALNEIIGILFILATVYFGWGIVQMIQGSGNEKKLEEGKKHMVWGIVGMVIMLGVWGIIALVADFLGIVDG